MVGRLVESVKAMSERRLLLVLILLAFTLRLYAVVMAAGISNDGAGYGFMAREFLRGNFEKGLSYTLHPFYPFLISLLSPNSASVEFVGRLISLLFGTLTLIPLYLLFKEAVGQKQAALSCLFYSFHPYLTTYSGMLLTEATYWGLLTLSVYSFWTGLTRGKKLRMIASGFFLALAYLTRPEGLGYIAVFLLWILFYGGIRRGWWNKIALAGCLVTVFLVFSSPYVLSIHRETGRWMISKKATVAQAPLLNLQQSLEKRQEEKVVPKDKPSLKNVPRRENNPVKKTFEMPRVIRNILSYLPLTTYHYLKAYHFSLWIFLFFGLIRKREGELQGELFFASMVLFHLVSLATFDPSTTRFSVPVVALSLFWAGGGVLELRRVLERLRLTRAEIWVSGMIALVFLCQMPIVLRPERRYRAEQKQVGIWLKAHTPPNAVIMGNSPQEVFYADREFILLPLGAPFRNPGASYQEVIDFAKQNKVEYVLVYHGNVDLNSEFVRSIRASELEPIHVHLDKKGRQTIIYRLVD